MGGAPQKLTCGLLLTWKLLLTCELLLTWKQTNCRRKKGRGGWAGVGRPYLPPCLVCAAINVAGVFFNACFMEETLPHLRRGAASPASFPWPMAPLSHQASWPALWPFRWRSRYSALPNFDSAAAADSSRELTLPASPTDKERSPSGQASSPDLLLAFPTRSLHSPLARA